MSTGRRVSLLGAVCAYCDSASKLNGHTLPEAIDGFLKSVVSVKRKDLLDAIEEFITGEELRTKAHDIIHSAKVASYFRRSEEFGIRKEKWNISLQAVRERKRKMVKGLIDVQLDSSAKESIKDSLL